MMKNILFILCILCLKNLFAQDIHFSQFNDLPLALNPALAGGMDGTFRSGIIYRNQWNSISVPFESTGVFADFKSAPRFLNRETIGWGIQLLNDRSGSGGLNENIASLSGSYQKYLNQKRDHIVTFGISIIGLQKSIDFSKLNFENQFQIETANFESLSSNELIENKSIAKFDLGTGAIWTYYNDYGYQLTAGMSIFHINRPSLSFYGNNDPLGRKFNLHASGIYPVNKKVDIDPSFLYSRQTKNNNFVIGTDILYNLGRKTVEKIDFKIGVYGRLKEAMNFTVGMNHDNWSIDIGYDLNVSSLAPVSRSRGAFEISISYVNRMFKGARNIIYVIPGDRLL